MMNWTNKNIKLLEIEYTCSCRVNPLRNCNFAISGVITPKTKFSKYPWQVFMVTQGFFHEFLKEL